MSKMCEACQDYACLGSWDIGYQLTTGHHPYCPDRGRIGANSSDIIDKLVSLVETGRSEVSRLATENQSLREELEEAEKELDGDEEFLLDTITQGSEIVRLRRAIEAIQYTLRQGFGDQYMLNRIKNLVDDAIDGHATDRVIVTDNDGEPD